MRPVDEMPMLLNDPGRLESPGLVKGIEQA